MDEQMKRLCDAIRETSFAIHKFLRHGHLEKVYENALIHRLTRQGLSVAPQHRLQVRDEDGAILGDYIADLFVEQCLIGEVKAVSTLVDDHVAQLLGYLRACRIENGLLINFGAPKLQIRKFILTQHD